MMVVVEEKVGANSRRIESGSRWEREQETERRGIPHVRVWNKSRRRYSVCWECWDYEKGVAAELVLNRCGFFE